MIKIRKNKIEKAITKNLDGWYGLEDREILKKKLQNLQHGDEIYIVDDGDKYYVVGLGLFFTTDNINIAEVKRDKILLSKGKIRRKEAKI